MKLLVFFLLTVLVNLSTSAQHFTTNKQFEESYALLLDLKFDEAERQIQAMRMADEQNLSTLYLEDLSDFLYIVVTEDAVEFQNGKN